ncbi:MAG: hypothetical protein GXO97_08860 [Nitrospirae bacterium]|nr:hypothetical protein [Nitrospirota bacterium]
MNDTPGIIDGRIPERVTLRVRSLKPYTSELTSEQIGLLAEIAEKYGAGYVHVTPRQTVEIPHIERSYIDEIVKKLAETGLSPGSTNRYSRNIIACSRWCLFNAHPMTGIAEVLNREFADREFPGKVDISLSGCDFSCVRSRTSDIGVIARAEVEITDKKCKKCSLCIKEPLGCQVDAIQITDDGVEIDTERCIRCGFCTNVCKPGSLKVLSRGFDIYVGGRGGIRPKEAVYLGYVPEEDELLDTIRRILKIYSEGAVEGERISDLIDKQGLAIIGAWK